MRDSGLMFKKFFVLFFIIINFISTRNAKRLSLKNSVPDQLFIQTHWIVDTVQDQSLRKNLVSYNPPLLTDDWVIVGNLKDGVKAYDKKTARLIWDFLIPSAGVSQPLTLHKGSLYFGGRDGFFYSLNQATGKLQWKYYLGAELAGQSIVHKERLYFLTQDQKLYALDLKGNLIWIHSHFFSSQSFDVKANKSPLIKEDLIYAFFQQGVVKALKWKDASLVWQNKSASDTLSQTRSVFNGAKFKGKCLLVAHEFCFDLKTGKLLSEAKIKSSAKKNLASPYFFPAFSSGDFLVYGFPHYGKLQIFKKNTEELLKEYTFGRGLAGPITADEKSLYFLTADSYLYKISLL